jgi:hypothetical protein
MFTRQSLDDPTQHEVVAPAPWHVKLWLVDVDCNFYDLAPTAVHDVPTTVPLPLDVPEEFIVALRQFSTEATAMLTDPAKVWPVIRTKLNVKTPYGEHLTFGLVEYAATLDFVSKDFVRRFALTTRKSPTKTPVRLANGQRVTSSTICDIALFELARHEFQRTLYVLRYLRGANMVLGLPWLDDEQASLHFITKRVPTLMARTTL